jgi:hypothetical protein
MFRVRGAENAVWLLSKVPEKLKLSGEGANSLRLW